MPTETGTAYTYEPPIVTTYGPGVPELEELESCGYVVSPYLTFIYCVVDITLTVAQMSVQILLSYVIKS